jgi:purine-binding chemotaxis protein CheW
MTTAEHSTTVTRTARAGKYLTFALGNEEYGLPILKVREIIGAMDVTAIPRTAAQVKGVINLRGQVIAVVDLRTAFGMEPAQRTDQTCIIVVEVTAGQRKLHAGIVVDRVSEVLNIAEEQIEDPPALAVAGQEGFILGVGKVGDSVKLLMDIDRVLATDTSLGIAVQRAAA